MVAWCAVSLVASRVTPLWADEVGDLKQQLQHMQQTMQAMEQKIERLESQQSRSASVSQVGADAATGALGSEKPAASTLQLPSGLSGVTLSGFTDVSYIYNFSAADSGTGRTNRGRLFDRQSNAFTPHAVELTLAKPLTADSPIGFQTNLYFGDDAEVMHSTGLGTGGSPSDLVDLNQAFVSVRAPVGEGLDFKLGKFSTLLGAEVTPSPENWNFSRSFLFTYAEPGTHTGALATYPLSSWGSVSAGVVNGWDIVDENNKAKSLLGGITVNPTEAISLTTNLITGAERTKDNRNDRTVVDLVATWKAMERLTLMANYDYGHESSLTQGLGTPGPDSANWQGLALYSKYDLTKKWALAGRFEWFDDMDGVRTAFTGLDGGAFRDLALYEWTLTSQWILHEHLLARLEYRHDKADERVFFRNSAGFTSYQDTASLELIARF